MLAVVGLVAGIALHPHHELLREEVDARVVEELLENLVGDLAALALGDRAAERLDEIDLERVLGVDRRNVEAQVAVERHDRTISGPEGGPVPVDRPPEPSASVVFARHPNRLPARETSRRRRGWPFGCDVSQRIAPA